MEHDVWRHGGSGGEVARPEAGADVPAALAACRLALRSSGAVTLAAAAGAVSEERFLGWVERDFRQWYAPQIARAYAAAAVSGVAELVAADNDFATMADGVFEPDTVVASRARGAAVVGTLTGARHARVGERFRQAVEAGECPGHAATAFGCHSAEMHVPLAEALLGFAHLEYEAVEAAGAGGGGTAAAAGAGGETGASDKPGGGGPGAAAWATALHEAVAEVTRSYGGGSDEFVACA